MKQTASHEKVVEKLGQLLNITGVLSMDREIVIQALSSGFKDFEDALQNFSAVKSGFINVILTRNVKDYYRSDIGIQTPENYLKSMTAGR